MRFSHFAPLPLLLLLTISCEEKKVIAGPMQMPPAAVTFVPVTAETVTLTRDLPGRIDAVRVAEVRARVPGILLKKSYQEGADVEAGDVLFEIDPAPLEVAQSSAAAALARAEAAAKQASNQVKRFRELVAVNAVSKQDADDSESAVIIAQADVEAAVAVVSSAKLNLGYATVTAPIAGRIGKAEVTEGALVGQGNATLMAVIQQLDPIYFDFTQSSSELLALKRAMGADQKVQSAVTLLLEDGTKYKHPGKLLFSGVSVDPTTGMVSLRAEFPNPDRDLLPGMFARARVVQSVRENVITVPQRAVTRAAGGGGQVMIIDEQNMAQMRVVQTGEPTGDKWVVTSGLEKGERVIVEGLLKARPGTPVVPEPYAAAPAANSSDVSNKN